MQKKKKIRLLNASNNRENDCSLSMALLVSARQTFFQQAAEAEVWEWNTEVWNTTIKRAAAGCFAASRASNADLLHARQPVYRQTGGFHGHDNLRLFVSMQTAA